MQIMNGFKELHKHKIMHRDFKLANIFLHDDKLVIGDFGFAKSGYDMATTKLGSPITMAPELLNGGNNVRYTNKADLWSIGVCFFNMIYGKPPWNASSMADLQNKVRTQSGKNTIFPTNEQISPECKDLIIRLMDPNPQTRMEFHEFFNHKLFQIHLKKQETPQPQDMRQSVMFRNNEDQVRKLWSQNQQNAPKGEVELVDPENITLETQPSQNTQADSEAEELERCLNRARTRYTHEKKTIVFFMHTCRKLRNLAKQRGSLGMAANGLMFAAMFLLRKGQHLNDIALNSIKNSQNAYNLEKFSNFASSNDGRRILNTLTSDEKLYKTLLDHLNKKLLSEVGPNDQRTRQVLQIVENPYPNISQINQELSQETIYLNQFYQAKSYSFPQELRQELAVGLAHLWISAKNETELPPYQENIPFDWNQFENSLTNHHAETVLQRIN
jgi:serine/threonine-protein kinase ULK/ATG1